MPLKAVADISFGQGPTRVRRYNQSRRVALEADLNGVELGTAMEKIKALPSLEEPARRACGSWRRATRRCMSELFANFAHRDGARAC